MDMIIRILIGAAGLSFLAAVLGTVYPAQVPFAVAEAYSRASTNLALLAIALGMVPRRAHG
jgi:hypothetical protein